MHKGFISVVFTALIFSSMEPVAKVVGGQMNAQALVFIRFVIGGLVLVPFAWPAIKKNSSDITLTDVLTICGMGVLFIAVNILIQIAVLYTKASTVAILFSTNPVFTVPTGRCFSERKMESNHGDSPGGHRCRNRSFPL